MKTIFIILALLIIAGLIFAVTKISIDSQEQEVIEWAKSKGLEVKSIETHITIIGTPFYYLHKGCYIFECEMTNGEKWWVRTGVFENDYEKEK